MSVRRQIHIQRPDFGARSEASPGQYEKILSKFHRQATQRQSSGRAPSACLVVGRQPSTTGVLDRLAYSAGRLERGGRSATSHVLNPFHSAAVSWLAALSSRIRKGSCPVSRHFPAAECPVCAGEFGGGEGGGSFFRSAESEVATTIFFLCLMASRRSHF
jgi:hypothetical protein